MLSRKNFEESLLRDDVVEYYLSKTREEIEQDLGENVAKMVGFEQKNSHHCYDLWGHTLKTVEGIKKEGLTTEEYKRLRIAAFFHDIGKPDVSGFNERTGQQTFYGHAVHSVEVARPILQKLGYLDEQIEKISFYIGHHDDFISYKSKIETEMKHHEYVRETSIDTVTEKILENQFDFEKMGLNKDQIRAIVYILAHGKKPEFRNFRGEPIAIEVDIDEVKRKMQSDKYRKDYQPLEEDYKLLLRLCRGDAGAQSEIVMQNGKVISSRADKIENFDKIDETIGKAYEKATAITGIEAQNQLYFSEIQGIISKLRETRTVVTHFGDDLDNKSAIYALEKFAIENGIIEEGEHLTVERVPAGKVKEGFLNVDTGGHKGSRFDENTLVIDGNPQEGINSAAAELARMGLYVPEQIVELADTIPNKVSPLESRTALSLIRSANGEQIFSIAEEGLLDQALTDEQLEKYGLVEAQKKQQEIIDTAVEKVKKYSKVLSTGEKVALVPESILAGAQISYELGVDYYVSVQAHKSGKGSTFAVTSKPGLRLPDKIQEFGKELVEKYKNPEDGTSGVFLNPNGQMLVAGGFKNPDFSVDYAVDELIAKLNEQFEEYEKESNSHNIEEIIEGISPREGEIEEVANETIAEQQRTEKEQKEKTGEEPGEN